MAGPYAVRVTECVPSLARLAAELRVPTRVGNVKSTRSLPECQSTTRARAAPTDPKVHYILRRSLARPTLVRAATSRSAASRQSP